MTVENFSMEDSVQIEPVEKQKDPVDVDGVFYFVLFKRVVGQVGIEPTTISLKGCCSTTELLTHAHFRDAKVKTQENFLKIPSVQKS